MPEIEYCIRCGAETHWHDVDGRPRRVCPACGHIVYKNPVVAAGALVVMDERVLLIQRGVEPGLGQWGLPAGYAEIGETPEETAIRETEEETGLVVALDGLLGVYAFGREAAQSGVVVLYTAHPVGGKMTAGDDAVGVRFFEADALPDEIAFAIHRRVLGDWAKAHGTNYRRATSADATTVARLIQQSAQDDASLVGRLQDETLLVAHQQDEIVGYATIRCREAKRPRLTHWYVLPAWRNWGIGRKLLNMATAQAAAQGADSLDVALDVRNNLGLATLLRQGFMISDLQTEQQSSQAIVRLDLSALTTPPTAINGEAS